MSMLNPSTQRTPVDPASKALAAAVAVPSSPMVTVRFWQTALGVYIPSITVTTALQLAWLPSWSVMVMVTVFGPILEQSKVFMSIVVVLIEQLSVLPASKSAAVMIA